MPKDRFLREKHFPLILLLIFIFGCVSSPPKNIEQSYSSYLQREDGTPKTVVILPFENETTKKGMGILVRKSFYNHFSSKNYRDIEISEVDEVLKVITDTSSVHWKNMDPPKLGEIFQADFLIYGKVKGFEKIFLGIYSQIALNIEIKMVECERGQVVWSKAPDYKSHDGGIPTTLIGIIPAFVRSGYHLRDEEVMELIERTNREMVAEIPDPPSPTVSTVLIEIQVASFRENTRARETARKFKQKGYRPRIEAAVRNNTQWYRVIIGPFYRSADAERVRNEIARDSEFKPIFIYNNLGNKKKTLN
ncbi:SPOR domain-containing protein [Thermodesulfobacteriota bacterium]